MANAPTRAPVTEQAFLADRKSFFSSFKGFVRLAITGVALLVLGMWIFLV